MAGGAAPELPALGEFLVGLLAALAWLGCVALLYSYRYSIGFLLDRLSRVLKIPVPLGPDIDLGGPVRALNNGIMHTLSVGATKSEHAMAYLFHGSAVLAEWGVSELLTFAEETWHWATWLQRSHLPRWVKALIYAAFPPALIARLISAGAHAAAHVTIPKVVIPHIGELNWIHRHWKALTAAAAAAGGLALPRPLAWPEFRRSWREIEKWRITTGKRLHRLEALLAASGLALAVARMTGTRVGCWRGQGNIVRALRHICGVPRWALDLFLLGTIEAFIVTDLCGFTDLLMQEAENLRPMLIELVDVEDALIGCHGTVKPIDFALPALSLPPMPAPSVLAA